MVSFRDKIVKNKGRLLLEGICILAGLWIVMKLLHVHTPVLIQYVMDDDISGLTDYIRQEGSLGEIILIGLQVLETVSIVLPSLPVYICSGIIFGKLEGILICYITNLLLNAIMFWVARHTSRTISANLTNSRSQKIIQKVLNMENPDRALVWLYLIPVIPNGLIPTIAAQTKIKFSHFILELALFCFPGIAVSVICGDALLTVHWGFSVPCLVIIILAAVLFFLFRHRITNWLERWKLKHIG